MDSPAMPFVAVAAINNRIISKERAAYDVNFEIITFTAGLGMITSWVDKRNPSFYEYIWINSKMVNTFLQNL